MEMQGWWGEQLPGREQLALPQMESKTSHVNPCHSPALSPTLASSAGDVRGHDAPSPTPQNVGGAGSTHMGAGVIIATEQMAHLTCPKSQNELVSVAGLGLRCPALATRQCCL